MTILKLILMIALCLIPVICIWKIEHWRHLVAEAYFILGISSDYTDIKVWAYARSVTIGHNNAWRYYALAAIDKFMEIQPRKLFIHRRIKCIVNYYYVPERYMEYATEEQMRNHNDILLFKMGTYGYAPKFIYYTCEDLEVEWGSLLVFMPCSTKEKYMLRYRELAERIQRFNGRIRPALDAVEYISDREPKHLPSKQSDKTGRQRKSVMSNVRLSDNLYGKYVVIFDDVYTTGDSIVEFAEALQAKGAVVEVAICLAKCIEMPSWIKAYKQAQKDRKGKPSVVNEILPQEFQDANTPRNEKKFVRS